MPIQTPQWTEYLSCPVCENGFELKIRLPISLGCGHTICKTCLSNLQRSQCPFDLCPINIPLDKLPVNTALVLLIDAEASLDAFREDFEKIDTKDDYTKADENENESSNGDKSVSEIEKKNYFRESMGYLEKLAVFLRPSNNQQMSRPMQRKLVTLINCQPLEEEGRARAIRAARSLGERSVTELILQHQNPQQLSANLWAAVRTRGCQFLGPAMQEEVLKLVLLALEDGSALSRKVLVMFVVQKLEPTFPQASKTSIGHVVQLLYRASCFKVTKRDGDSSLMQLKEEFRTYETLRREHDAQIVQIATEAGLRIAPDQWSSLLYGDTTHKSHMQSIIDKLQTPQSFLQSVQELVIALQRTGDPGKLAALRPHLDLLSGLDPNPENTSASDWPLLQSSLHASEQVVAGLITFIGQHSNNRRGGGSNNNMVPNGINSQYGGERSGSAQESASFVGANLHHNSRYKTSMCRDLTNHGSCPRGKNCSFAHSSVELDQYRSRNNRQCTAMENNANEYNNGSICGDGSSSNSSVRALSPRGPGHHNNHSQFNSTNIQLPSQPHPPSNSSGIMAGGSAHRMPSPAPSMRVPPLMSAVSPMTAPVAQVAPVPRGFDHNQNQPMSQVVPLVRYATPNVPPPSNPSLQQQQNHSHHPQPQANIINPDAVVALAPAGPPPPTIPPNHGAHPSQPTHIVGHHPQVGIAPQIQVHYPTLFQATLTMPQQGHHHIDQSEQQVPDPQQSHQQVYHYQQEIQLHPRTPESLRDEDIKPAFPLTIAQTAKVATKSLSALKSRKEEIIDSLQDIVGKEETKKISVRTEERANVSSISAVSSMKKVGTVASVESVQKATQPMQAQQQKGDPILSLDQDYSLWTSKAFTPFVNVENDANVEENESLNSEEQGGNEVSYSISHSISDELIPFSDSPQISRFGPISRKGITSMRNKPSQSQAIIDDQAHVSPVVSNSKQMSRPAPSLPTAFLQQTNGTFMALQPVAVGVNGEIGYVAVQQPNPESSFVPGQEMAMDHQNFLNNVFSAPPITSPSHHSSTTMINQNSVITGCTQGGGAFGNNDTQPSQEALRQESERMKHELEVLQKKISCLNTARRNNSQNGGGNFNFRTEDRSSNFTNENKSNEVISNSGCNTVAQNETKQLATELQLIENTIKDREREIILNRQPNMANDGAANVEYGSYLAQGLISESEEINNRVQSITTTARSGQMTRTNENYFEPI